MPVTERQDAQEKDFQFPDPSPRRNWKLVIVVLAAIALIGSLYLPQPFYDDQALFTIGAQEMSQHRVLYRDYWDIKQPGIFIFYLLGGELFGFNEVGIHAFELLYLIAFAAILSITLRRYYESSYFADLVPLVTVGIYYGVSGITQLGQVEGLVCFPMFLCLWFAYFATQEVRLCFTKLWLSGLFGGIVLMFKFVFAPIILSFWILSLLYIKGRQTGSFIALTRKGLAISAGVLIPLGVTFAYFAHFDILRMVGYTFFIYPIRAATQLPHAGPGRLLDSLQWFLASFAPLLALGLVGAWGAVIRRRDSLTVFLVLWLVVGAAVVLLQRTSWWRYHFMLFVLPLGLLAAKGIEIVWAGLSDNDRTSIWIRGRYFLPTLSLILLFSPIVNSIFMRLLVLARYRFAITEEDRRRYQGDSFLYPDTLYPSVMMETKFLSEGDSLPGAIYVIGNPLFYYLSQRPQAIAPAGGFENFLPEQWNRLGEELKQASPPYIFIAASDRDLFQRQARTASQFVQANYRIFRIDEAGTWYILAAEIAP